MPHDLKSSQIIIIISGFEYTTVLNMPRYGYNNVIIIVTNVIILEFLSAVFVYLDTPQVTTSSLTRVRT